MMRRLGFTAAARRLEGIRDMGQNRPLMPALITGE